jgi:hypothetical protein
MLEILQLQFVVSSMEKDTAPAIAHCMTTIVVHDLAPIDVQHTPIIGRSEEAICPCRLDVKVGGPPNSVVFWSGHTGNHLSVTAGIFYMADVAS